MITDNSKQTFMTIMMIYVAFWNNEGIVVNHIWPDYHAIDAV